MLPSASGQSTAEYYKQLVCCGQRKSAAKRIPGPSKFCNTEEVVLLRSVDAESIAAVELVWHLAKL